MRKSIFILLITLYFKILPIYASAFVCNDFIKDYSYQQSDLDYVNIYKKMNKVKSELLMLRSENGVNDYFVEKSFIYAELMHWSGYIEKKYYISDFSFEKKIKNLHTKVLIKLMKNRDNIESLIHYIEHQNYFKNNDYILKIYSYEKLEIEKYKKNLNRLQSKLKKVRIYHLDISNILFNNIKQIRSKVLSLDNQDIKYVILANKPIPQELETGFPILRNKTQYKILLISEAFKMIPYFPYVYYILPRYYAHDNEWVYDKKQSYFEIAEHLNIAKNSLNPKEYYVVKGVINEVNILKGHTINNFETVLKKGSMDLQIQNIDGTKSVKYILMLANPIFYFSLKNIREIGLEKYKHFLNIIQEINGYLNIKQQKNHVAYAEWFQANNKNIELKYFAVDNKDFEKSLTSGNNFFISLNRKNFILHTIENEENQEKAYSEQKILEYLLMQTKHTGIKTGGKLKIFSTHEICHLCRNFYPVFKKLRPYIEIELYTANVKNLDKFYAEILN